AGSFKKKDNAKKLISNLSKKGMDSFSAPTTISGETWYIVQAGAFTKRKNAEKCLEAVKNAGFKAAYILTDEVNVCSDGGYAIRCQTYLSPHHMNQYVKEINADAIELGQYYLTFGAYYGIRGDIAFAQAMHETDYFRFTGVVKPEQ